LQKEIHLDLLLKREIKRMCKKKSLNMFDVPPPLSGRGGREVRLEQMIEKNDKKPRTANHKPQTNFIFANL